MHAALASSTANPDFTPETFTATDAQKLSAEIAAQAEASLSLLREKAAGLPATEQQLALRVLTLEPQITKRFSALAVVSTSAKRIRYHGDYHLGQLLYTGSDFMLIDFEGEPARPLSERRQKAMALRDVAGMLRSFQYAAYSGTISTDPHSAEKLAACSAFWHREASKIFLDAYLAEAGAKRFLPSTPEQRTFFLEMFLLQKALYEVQYELNNRPTWVGIPLRGILSLIEN
jgi:maltose alpha-D-glucosyltransferase/alpha-amylase